MDKTELQALLLAEEGEVLHAYTDSLGFITIGCGHLIDQRKGGGISPKISRLLLNDDMETAYSQLINALPWTTALGPIRQNTLVAMVFQLGLDGLKEFKLMLAYLQGEHYDLAAGELLNSRLAKQTPARAQRMANRIRSGTI